MILWLLMAYIECYGTGISSDDRKSVQYVLREYVGTSALTMSDMTKTIALPWRE